MEVGFLSGFVKFFFCLGEINFIVWEYVYGIDVCRFIFEG